MTAAVPDVIGVEDEADLLVVSLQQVVYQIGGGAAVGKALVHHFKGVEIVVPLLPVNRHATVSAAVADFGGQQIHQHIAHSFDLFLYVLRLHIQKGVGFLGGACGPAQHMGNGIPIHEFGLDMPRFPFLAAGQVFLIPVKLQDILRILRGIAAEVAIQYHLRVRLEIECLGHGSVRAGDIVFTPAVADQVCQFRDPEQREYLFHDVRRLLPPPGHGIQREHIAAPVHRDHIAAEHYPAIVIHIHCHRSDIGNIISQDVYGKGGCNGRGHHFFVPLKGIIRAEDALPFFVTYHIGTIRCLLGVEPGCKISGR